MVRASSNSLLAIPSIVLKKVSAGLLQVEFRGLQFVLKTRDLLTKRLAPRGFQI